MRSSSAALLVLLASSAVAQERHPLRVLPGPVVPGARLSDVPPPVIRATYDVATGTIRDRSVVPAGGIALGVAPCFDNSDLVCDMGPFEPYTIGNQLGDEMLDWGVKDCNGSGLVRSVTIAYRTTALDTADGGPGATLSFGLYRGTRGFNVVGTEVFRRTFTGLPAQAAPANNSHEAPFVFLTIDFGSQPLPLPDGPIGWGYMLLDNEDTDFATGALLVNAPNAATGVVDALDVFTPGPASAGNYLGTFNFASVCNHPPCCPKASTWLQIVEAPSGAEIVNGNGTNPAVFHELLRARLGQSWVTHFDLSGHPGTSATMIFATLGSTVPRATPFGELFLAPPRLGPPFVALGLHMVPIPLDPGLDGLVIHTQGVLSGTTLTLTNGLDITLGY
jgi:hypothetical protein